MNNAIAMVRRRVERIELQLDITSVDNVVIGSSWNDNGEARTNLSANAIQDCLTGTFLDAEKLIELMHFHAELFCGVQRHENKLAVFCRIEHAPEIQVLNTHSLNILDKTFLRLAPQ